SLQMTESDLARELFERIASGSSATSEAQRFNSMGVPTTRRYRNGKSIEPNTIWGVSRVINMVNNTVYIGKHSFKSRNGSIVRDVPALVEEATWQQVQKQLKQNRRLPKSNATRDYPLRGLVTCVNCGAYFVGTTIPRRNGKRDHYYRCGSSYKRTHHNGKSLCQAKSIPAEQLENMVWNGCHQLISSPEAALEALQQQLDSRLSETSNVQRERERLSQALLVKDQEKERILTVFRRGRINIDELEHHLEAIHREEADLKQRLGALDAQRQVIDAMTDHFRDANALLGRLRDRLLGLDGPTDPLTKHQIITQLVSGVRIETDLTVRPKNAHISITYILFQTSTAKSSTHEYYRVRNNCQNLSPAFPLLKTSYGLFLRTLFALQPDVRPIGFLGSAALASWRAVTSIRVGIVAGSPSQAITDPVFSW
ncbi:MAG: recombinase family protein, partial [Candidatus Tectomicrobia bacterium]|nr:recombinase family protein [Candidatus Tectomicrobia bacterium]